MREMVYTFEEDGKRQSSKNDSGAEFRGQDEKEDGVKKSMISNDLTEDAEDRKLWRTFMKDTYLIKTSCQ